MKQTRADLKERKTQTDIGPRLVHHFISRSEFWEYSAVEKANFGTSQLLKGVILGKKSAVELANFGKSQLLNEAGFGESQLGS